MIIASKKRLRLIRWRWLERRLECHTATKFSEKSLVISKVFLNAHYRLEKLLPTDVLSKLGYLMDRVHLITILSKEMMKHHKITSSYQRNKLNFTNKKNRNIKGKMKAFLISRTLATILKHAHMTSRMIIPKIRRSKNLLKVLYKD